MWEAPLMQTVHGRKGLGKGMDCNKVLNLFNRSDQLESRLSKLSFGQDREAALDWKKYRNVCYMFELFCALVMKESDNITQNPSCEWQLQLYSPLVEQWIKRVALHTSSGLTV
jgi:hypothetical protein